MDIRTKVFQTVADAFGKSPEELKDDTRLIEDLDAKSVNYFPIMNALEEEYDLELQYQTFRSKCPTIKDIIKLVEEEA